jgi:hypothetical protein
MFIVWGIKMCAYNYTIHIYSYYIYLGLKGPLYKLSSKTPKILGTTLLNAVGRAGYRASLALLV